MPLGRIPRSPKIKIHSISAHPMSSSIHPAFSAPLQNTPTGSMHMQQHQPTQPPTSVEHRKAKRWLLGAFA